MIESDAPSIAESNDDLLWEQLKTLPAFRAVLRAVEARFYHHIDFPGPVLDVGCGDANFAEIAFEGKIHAGIDPWWNPLRKAIRQEKYDLTLQVLADNIPFPDHYFGSAFSNSVIEHIPDIQPVLNEVSRVLKPGAKFVITTPSQYFTECLGGAQFFEKLGIDSLADKYRDFFNFISRHAHTDSPETWSERFAEAGMVVERWQFYYSNKALHAHEIGHVQGLPSAAIHALTNQWIVAPWNNSLKPTERWLRPIYDEEFPEKGAYILMIARKVADEPIEPVLPPAQPFTQAELAPDAPAIVDEPAPIVATAAAAATRTPSAEIDADATQKKTRNEGGRRLLAGGLGLLTLLFALLAQSSWRGDPTTPWQGLRWLIAAGLSLAGMFAVLRSRDGNGPSLSWPNLSGVPRERWLVLLGLLLAFVAQRFANGVTPRPWLALLMWAVAIGVGVYGLLAKSGNGRNMISAVIPRSSTTWLIAGGFFLLALVPRLVNLSSHPFILNGTEANLGLDAVRLLEGNIRSPFSTAWLTNPTLPLYLLALPIKILGQTTLAVRLMSTLFGALTVAGVYLFGQRLFDRTTGLISAVILLGSSFHIHFSRLGMTNVWDGLIVLLALGFLAMAWRQSAETNRLTWLLAGSAVGLSAYLYTASHLLPLMLVGIALLVVLLDRAGLARQWRHALAAALLALIVALPQLAYYRANPGIFMERANALGILDSQTGWLSAEAARTATSQIELLWQQFWQAALAFNATIDTSTSYGAFMPFLGTLAGIFLVIGVLVALLRLRQMRYHMLLVWLLVTIIFGGALLLTPPNSHRFIIAAPAVALLAGIGLAELGRALFPASKSPDAPWYRKPAAVMGLLLGVAALAALLDTAAYFGPYANQNQFGDRNTEIADEMATYLNSLDGDWTAYFYGPPAMYSDFPTIAYLATEFERGANLHDVVDASAELPPAATENRTFIFLPERQNDIGLAQVQFPNGTVESVAGVYSQPLFIVYEIDATAGETNP